MAVVPVGSAASSLPLRVEALVKRFGPVTALDGVTLQLEPGECLGLLGSERRRQEHADSQHRGTGGPGCGHDCGVRLRGRFRGGAHRAGWVPQELALYPRLTCRENLESFGRYYGLSGGALRDAVAWCLGWAALTDRAAELVKNLSGGMKRRLNMAAGMIHRPKLVLMDEPTVGVDPQSRNRIFEMIEKLHGDGMSIIYTTHYMEEAERLCDRIAIVDHGHIIAMGSSEELVQSTFGSRSEVLARFQEAPELSAGWVERRGGRPWATRRSLPSSIPPKSRACSMTPPAPAWCSSTFLCAGRRSNRCSCN